MTPALGIHRSHLGQAWRWRDGDGDGGGNGAGDDDLLTRLLLSRGATRDALDAHRSPTIRGFMPDPSAFRDMDRSAARIADAVEAGARIGVFGDYDVDGATSSALLVRLFEALGCPCEAYIPCRMTEGYGPSITALSALRDRGAELIVTVDCGAQAFEPLAAAAAAGIPVIVVDHHQCAALLPVAHAVVNPNRLDEEAIGQAHGHLAAVGVCFLLAAAIVRTLRARGRFATRAEPKLIDLLDLVALGTVADVAKLHGLNRAFVAQGLKVMAGRRNVGLAALADAARLTRAPGCQDLGFALGPRINAGGRVGRSDLGMRLLTTACAEEARTIALELDRLNEERRAIEAGVQEDAARQAAAQAGRSVVVVAARGWHPGVIGIVAGRLKEAGGRPAFVIAVGDDGGAKGSGRSIAGVDLGAAVLAAKETGLVAAGGGHAMAAGVTLTEDGIAGFAAFLDARLAADVAAATANRALLLDTMVAPRGVTPELVDALDAGGPYGTGWPAPRVATGPVRIVEAKTVGATGDHVRVTAAGEDGARLKAVAWRAASTPLGQALLGARPERRLWLAGRARADEWQGARRGELHVEDAADAG